MFAASAEENDRTGVFSFRALYEAYLNCRKRKRNTHNALRFEADLFGNLFNLKHELETALYRPTRSVCFFTSQPKLREIIAADFRDRVVHHLGVAQLERVFEPKFIHDSYACRLNKGTHAAVNRLKQFIHQLRRREQKAVWYLQLDIRSFFMNIDHNILLELLARHVHSKQIMTLTEIIIRHDPTENCLVKDRYGLAASMPPHKSLFALPPGQGLPIGNLSSQFFANVYLNELDQFVKHTLKCRYYLRYVDDFILLGSSPDSLEVAGQRITTYLADHLKLALREEAVPRRSSDGINFLGYITRADYTLVRQRVVGNLKAKLGQFERNMIVQGKAANQVSWQINAPPESVLQLQQVLSSYMGHFKHADSYCLMQRVFKWFPFLSELFGLVDGNRRLRLRFKPPQPPRTLASQYRWFTRQHTDCIVLAQVGRFCELYNHSALQAKTVLRLKHTRKARGFAIQAGFPMQGLRRAKQRLRQAGLAYIVIAEHGYLRNGLKQRVMTEKFFLLPTQKAATRALIPIEKFYH